MKNPYPILHSYGIYDPQLHKLYRCRLTGILEDLPGISTASLRVINNDLANLRIGPCAPEDCTWAYDLLFDVLKISKKPELFCHPQSNNRSVLSRLTTFQYNEMSQLNQLLAKSFDTKLQLGIIYAQYRDHLTATDMSCHFNTPVKQLRQSKKLAMYILRDHNHCTRLEQIMLTNDTDIP